MKYEEYNYILDEEITEDQYLEGVRRFNSESLDSFYKDNKKLVSFEGFLATHKLISILHDIDIVACSFDLRKYADKTLILTRWFFDINHWIEITISPNAVLIETECRGASVKTVVDSLSNPFLYYLFKALTKQIKNSYTNKEI